MQRLDAEDAKLLLRYFHAAAETAKHATCQRAQCGSLIVKGDRILGRGYNGPPLGKEGNRTCNKIWDYSKKPKYDLTCCIHAEWRAIIQACKDYGSDVAGSRLYFMRIDDNGNFTDAGIPYCTVCSRLSMEAGIKDFAVWNHEGVDIYPAAEFDKLSYNFYKIK